MNKPEVLSIDAIEKSNSDVSYQILEMKPEERKAQYKIINSEIIKRQKHEKEKQKLLAKFPYNTDVDYLKSLRTLCLHRFRIGDVVLIRNEGGATSNFKMFRIRKLLTRGRYSGIETYGKKSPFGILSKNVTDQDIICRWEDILYHYDLVEKTK